MCNEDMLMNIKERWNYTHFTTFIEEIFHYVKTQSICEESKIAYSLFTILHKLYC